MPRDDDAADGTPAKATKVQATKVQGPASYFPSIERTYGRPIDEWLDLVRASPLEGHKEKVDWLKSEHGLGHGHANAIVAYVKLNG
ncbi:MAG: DUF4287 domain-containing protein [Actinomycetota bacterium]|nr:DUF4287 domain-containing protein [Actinomycetota bacterium]